MPIYCYVCPECGYTYEDIQAKMTGTKEIGCPNCFREATPRFMQRDFAAEKPGIIADFEPGYNMGIDEHYTSKADLMRKIRRKGLYASRHGGTSLTKSDSGLYGDEEFKDIKSYSKPEEEFSDALP